MKDKEILNSKNTDILKQIPKSWHDIDWKKAGKEVAILQEKIVIAGQYKKHKEVKFSMFIVCKLKIILKIPKRV